MHMPKGEVFHRRVFITQHEKNDLLKMICEPAVRNDMEQPTIIKWTRVCADILRLPFDNTYPPQQPISGEIPWR